MQGRRPRRESSRRVARACPIVAGFASGDPMQFGYTILYVEDVPATLAFYGQAFGLATRYTHESGSYGELETGTTALAFVSRALLRQIGKSPQPPELDKPTSEIALVTDDVPAATARAV